MMCNRNDLQQNFANVIKLHKLLNKHITHFTSKSFYTTILTLNLSENNTKGEIISYTKKNATAINTGSANQRPNTPCIRLWIDITFRGLEDSYLYLTKTKCITFRS